MHNTPRPAAAPHAFAIAQWPDHAITAKAWGAAAGLGVLCTGFAFVFYYRLIARVGPARAATTTYLVPLFAVLWAWLLLGEAVIVPSEAFAQST